MALVVDDLGLSFESTVRTRDALRKFVAENVRPGDLVAILRTGKAAGVLQQLTADTRQLYEAIDRLRYNQMGREGLDSYTPIEPSALTQATVGGRPVTEQPAASATDSVFADFRDQLNTTATLAALNLTIRGLQKLPGRKSIVLFSNGLDFQDEMFAAGGGKYSPGGVQTVALRERLIDLAHRASVVIYAVDPSGLEAPFTIRDNFSGASPEQVMGTLQSRGVRTFRKQMGMDQLAESTGGFLFKNNNDLAAGLRRVAAELEGYYLIGYRPDDSTFDPKTGRRLFRSLKVKVRRPGLTVRSRAGFLGYIDSRAPTGPAARGDSLAEALVSPFEGQGLRLRLTSLFSDDPKAGPVMRSLIHVDARDLTFTEEPDGRRKAVFDVAGATFGAAGQIVEKIDQTSYTMRVSDRTYRRLLQTGFVYTIDFPVRRAGAYQLRFSVRDRATMRVGSTGHFVVVPDLGDDRLALSGVVLRGRPQATEGDGARQQAATAAAAPPERASSAAGRADGQEPETDVQASPAVRRFRAGATLDYAYLVYNARTTSGSPRPRLTEQVRLFREGKLIYTGVETPIGAEGQQDLKRIGVAGELQLGATAAAGEYTIQIVVKDSLAPEKRQVVSQWIDFEIVK
jgi:VWFA-related protein